VLLVDFSELELIEVHQDGVKFRQLCTCRTLTIVYSSDITDYKPPLFPLLGYQMMSVSMLRATRIAHECDIDGTVSEAGTAPGKVGTRQASQET